MHPAQHLPEHATRDAWLAAAAGDDFSHRENAFGSAFGCAPSWTNGCAGHHYRSWSDPTLRTHTFGPPGAGTATSTPAAPRVRPSLRSALAFAGRCFHRRPAA